MQRPGVTRRATTNTPRKAMVRGGGDREGSRGGGERRGSGADSRNTLREAAPPGRSHLGPPAVVPHPFTARRDRRVGRRSKGGGQGDGGRSPKAGGATVESRGRSDARHRRGGHRAGSERARGGRVRRGAGAGSDTRDRRGPL